jgi:hypothetical protein
MTTLLLLYITWGIFHLKCTRIGLLVAIILFANYLTHLVQYGICALLLDVTKIPYALCALITKKI